MGTGTTNDSVTPTQVAGLSAVTQVSAGFHFSTALSYGTDGQIGDNAAANALRPVQVPGITGATAVAAGNYHSLAIVQGGAV